MRRRLIRDFITDHPITALLIAVLLALAVFLAYRFVIAILFVMEFSR